MSNRHEKKEGNLISGRISWECQRAVYSGLRSPVLAVIPLEIAAMLFVSAKGAGQIYLDLLPLLILITVLADFFTCLIRGNQKIVMLSLILLTVGTMLQSIFRAELLLKKPDAYAGGSAAAGLQLQYLAAFALAVAAGFIYRRFRICSSMRTAEILTVFSILLAGFTLVFARGVGGVRNWVHLGGLSFQTTELVKFLYLFISAALLGTTKEPSSRRIRAFFAVSLVEMGFLVLQNEFGTLLLILMIFLTFLFMFVPDLKVFAGTAAGLGLLSFLAVTAGVKLKQWAAAGKAIAANPLAVRYLSSFNKIANRFIYWRHPESDPLGQGYQLLKARESILLGGWFGTSSITDLPVKTSDLVFPALIQRCGMIFAFLVFLVFILLWLEGMKVCVRKKDRYHRMMAVGLLFMFFDQTIIIIAGSTGLCPLTGITLPFISSGGSSLVVSFMLISVLLCISGDISWKGISNEEDEFFAKSTDRAKRILTSGYQHVCGSVQKLRTPARSVGGGGPKKSRRQTGRV